jgi:hypothetical protein
MSDTENTKLSRRTVALAGSFGALAASTQAFAAECPPDKRGLDLIPAGTNVPKGVVD